jgi:tetratricopeptide (TPR) repeat protein
VSRGRTIIASRLDWAVVTIALATALMTASCQLLRGDPLSPEGRQSYQRGLAALEAQQWETAIKRLREVQTGDRLYPPLLRDLGRAYAGGGHEGVAIAWFQAYLVAEPDARDGPTMRAELARLEAAGQAKVRHLLEQALETFESLPGELTKAQELRGVAHFTAFSGDITRALEIQRRRQVAISGALRTLETQTGEKVARHEEAGLWADYAQALAGEGDIKAAEDVLARYLTRPDDRDHAFHGIAMHFFEHEGDAEAARKAANQIQNPARRDDMIALIERQERDGRLRARARTTVFTVIKRAQAISALHERRLKVLWDDVERQGQSPHVTESPSDPRALLQDLALAHATTRRAILLQEQALALATTLRELRVQARKIACCLERP